MYIFRVTLPKEFRKQERWLGSFTETQPRCDLMMQKPAEMCHIFILVREVTKSHWVKCTKFAASQWYKIKLQFWLERTWEFFTDIIYFSEVKQKYVQLQKNQNNVNGIKQAFISSILSHKGSESDEN